MLHEASKARKDSRHGTNSYSAQVLFSYACKLISDPCANHQTNSAIAQTAFEHI